MYKFITVMLLVCMLNNHAKAACHDNSIASIKFVSMKTGEVKIEENSSFPINPGSALKILTLYLAQKKLGEDFKYQTEIFSKQDNLYIRFSGDPTLRIQDLDVLISKVRKKSQIFNNVYLDGEIFSYEPYAPGVSNDNLKFAFAAPVSAFSIDKNYVKFLKSGSKILSYKNTSMLDLLKLQVKAKPLEDISTDVSTCPLELFNTGPNQYLLEGCYEIAPEKLNIAVSDPRKYALDAVTKLFKKHNIKVNNVSLGKVEHSAIPIATHKSEDLYHLMYDMMHKSDNHIADSLIRLMTYNHFKKPASWFLVGKFLKDFIEQDLLVTGENQIQIVDGSGLSRKNYVNANFMIALLERIYQNKATKKLFLETVPNFGTADSTLQNRSIILPGKVYAKTGSLEAVSSLCGIMIGDDGEDYIFSILANSFISNNKNRKSDEENILKQIFFQ